MERHSRGPRALAAAVVLCGLLVCGTVQLAECRRLEGTSRMSRLLRHLLPSNQAGAKHVQEAAEDFILVQDGQHKEQDLGGMAMAPSPSSNTPAPPSPVTPASCPPTVSECDFYFQGSQASVPAYSISKAKPDGPISPAPIVTSVQGTSITVVVMNTAKAQYICGATLPPDDQFYTSGTFVQARTFQPGTLGNYLNQYVRLNLSSVQINAFGMTFNLNPGQANNFFPEERRCVIFQAVL